MAKSHRAYDKNNNPLKFEKSFKERLKQFKNVDAWSKEGIAEREAFAKQFGRAWYLFQESQMRYNREKTWIEQFNVYTRRPRGKERSK